MALDIILAKYKWKTCLVYLDYVIVFSKTYDEYLSHLDEVLTVFNNPGVTLQLRNCELFTDLINHLGHIIRQGTLELKETATLCFKASKITALLESSEVSSGCVMYTATLFEIIRTWLHPYTNNSRVISNQKSFQNLLIVKIRRTEH